MGKTGAGFRLGRRLVKIFRWCVHRRRRARRRATSYHRLDPPADAASKIRGWLHSLRRGAGAICPGRTKPGYVRIGEESAERQRPKLPKGHVVVYVGDKEGDTCRVAVPVVYVNHPLFGELLREAERVHGFDHPGGIQIPCPKARLESVQMRIAAARGGGRWRR